MKKELILTIIFFLFFLSSPEILSAKTDLSIAVSDITFSKTEPVAGQTVRIFARVFNLGDVDAYGFVIFLKNGKEMAEPQPISVKINTYDDVFIDWTAESGTYNIQAKIASTNPQDEEQANNQALQENYSVDLDSDGDKIGNNKDLDDDNDGLPDEKELTLGTDPLNPDTDGDKAKDGIDPFPLDKTEWQDSDKDGLGDNKDIDDDNDGLSDEEEIFSLGTNPLNSDTDGDGFSDSKEKDFGTNALLADTDNDGTPDSKDAFPLDPTKAQASIFQAFRKFIEDKGLFKKPAWLVFGLIFTIALILFFFRRKKH